MIMNVKKDTVMGLAVKMETFGHDIREHTLTSFDIMIRQEKSRTVKWE